MRQPRFTALGIAFLIYGVIDRVVKLGGEIGRPLGLGKYKQIVHDGNDVEELLGVAAALAYFLVQSFGELPQCVKLRLILLIIFPPQLALPMR